MNIPQLDSTYIANTYARFPVTIARGKGSLVWDADDKVYIDMATGIAVNSFGIADPAWIRAVTEQLCTVQHASNLYYTAPDAQLAQLLCEKTGMKKVFFSNSGAEANECAIKAARKYAADHKGPEYSHHHHAQKQLPRPHDHNARRDRAGRVPPRLSAADGGLCLRRGE